MWPDRRGGAAPAMCSPAEVTEARQSVRMGGTEQWIGQILRFRVSRLEFSFLWFFLSFEVETFLDGSGSEQNVLTAPAPTEMCRLRWLRHRPRLRIPATETCIRLVPIQSMQLRQNMRMYEFNHHESVLLEYLNQFNRVNKISSYVSTQSSIMQIIQSNLWI